MLKYFFYLLPIGVFWFDFGWACSSWAGCLGWKTLGRSSSHYPNGYCFYSCTNFHLS